MALHAWGRAEGVLTPLGATWIESAEAYNFALYSKNATAVSLLLYGDDDFVKPIRTFAFDFPAHKTARIWHMLVPAAEIAGAKYYAKVILDVVYNHTTECDQNGPTYSFRGIDNSTHYSLDSGDLSRYFNFSACGNDLRTSHPAVRRLVVDSLRYWVSEMGVRQSWDHGYETRTR